MQYNRLFAIDFSNHICTMRLQSTVNQYIFILRKKKGKLLAFVSCNGRIESGAKSISLLERNE